MIINMKKVDLQVTAEIAGDHLNKILELFKPGARIALAVWFPGEDEQDFTLLHPEATMEDAINTFVRRRDAPDSIRGRA